MRTATCNCINCNNIGTVPMNLNRRGNRLAYLCEFHARRLEGYFTENDAVIGVNKVSKNTFGCELETSYSSPKARAEIVANGYIPTMDCTVDVEYKSPIMIGLNSFSKQCKTLDSLIESGDLRIGDECGTHFHFGDANYINAETMGYIRRFYNSIFVPLSDAISATPAEAAELFGRGFNTWARPINMNTDAEIHENFINTQHTYSLEFRIVKYQNADQMMKVARLVKAIGNCIIENFIKHFNDDDFDRTRYATIREYRLHKAQVTGNKIVKLYMKAINA